MKKKMVIIFLLCSICLAICACNMKASDEVNKNDSTEQQIATSSVGDNQHDSKPHYTSEQQNEIIKSQEGERPLLTFESQNEYTKFLNLNKMPDDFVSYNKINNIGTFKSLVFTSDAYNNDYSSYMYTLIDSIGFEITLYVDHNEGVLSKLDSISNLNGKDMRLLSDTRSGVYISNGLKYQYVSGQLLSISWEFQDINYSLCSSEPSLLSNYPLTESTFVGKMINNETAVQTLNNIYKEK